MELRKSGSEGVTTPIRDTQTVLISVTHRGVGQLEVPLWTFWGWWDKLCEVCVHMCDQVCARVCAGGGAGARTSILLGTPGMGAQRPGCLSCGHGACSLQPLGLPRVHPTQQPVETRDESRQTPNSLLATEAAVRDGAPLPDSTPTIRLTYFQLAKGAARRMRELNPRGGTAFRS